MRSTGARPASDAALPTHQIVARTYVVLGEPAPFPRAALPNNPHGAATTDASTGYVAASTADDAAAFRGAAVS